MTKKTFAAGILAAAVLAAPALAAEPIKIGVFAGTTGPAAFLGDPQVKTLQLYVDKINAGGGVLGRKLALSTHDTGADPNKAKTIVKRFLAEEQVDIVIGGATSGESLAVMDLVAEAKTPFIALASSEKIVNPVNPWVFKIPPHERLVVDKIYRDMNARGIAKVGLISDTGAYGKSGHDVAVEMAPKYGIEIVADEVYGPADPDMSAQLTKIKGSAKLDAVFVFGFGSGASTVTRNYRQLDFKVPMYQTHGVASKKFIELGGGSAEGVRLPTSALMVADALPDADPQKAMLVAFRDAFEGQFKTDIPTFAGNAYDALHLAVAAWQAAGSTDKEKTRAALEATKGKLLVSGTFNMSATDHNGLDLSALRMVEVKNGGFVLAK